MLKLYSDAKSYILCLCFFSSLLATAQNTTAVTASRNCQDIIADFDNGDGNFTSRSPFSSTSRDASFYYNRRRGFWTEVGNDGSERTTPPATPADGRLVTIISRVYSSPTLPGVLDVGFSYVVPNPATDQFAINVIRVTAGNPEKTDVVAQSDFVRFSEFSSVAPVPYTDPFGNAALTGFRGAICVRLTDPDITSAPNITYRIDISYLINTPGTFTVFDDFALGGVTPIPLPVNFVGLFAKRNGSGVELRWDVANEVNVKEYIVERSFTGSSFTAVGTVKSGTKSFYSFMDPAVGDRAVFYRIRNVDNDGRSKQSSIVKLSGATSFSNTFKLYPLPAGNMVTIEHPALPVGSEITIRTAEGQVLRRFQPRAAVSHTPLDLTGIVSGLYLIHINTGNGNGETLKLIKR